MRIDERNKRAALYRTKAQEAYRLGAEAKSPEIHSACLALAAHWNALARFQLSDQIGELVDQARSEDSGWPAPGHSPAHHTSLKT